MIGPQRLVGASEVVLRAPARGRSNRGYYRRLGVVAALAAALLAAVAVLMAVGPAWAAAPPTGEAGVAIQTAPAGTVAGSVDAGNNHSCGVKTDGTLACWGDNPSGQGDSRTNIPQQQRRGAEPLQRAAPPAESALARTVQVRIRL